MTPEELERLWDPKASHEGAEAIVDLERAAASLRGPNPAPPLALPPRRTAQPQDDRRVWGMAAAIVLVAASLLVYFVLRSATHSAGDDLVVEAPQRPDVITQREFPGWRVEALVGEQMCQAVGVEQAVREGELLPDEIPFDTGPGSTAHLRNGAAAVDLHPNSRIGRVGEVLELHQGRLWAELPSRRDGETWRLRTSGMELESDAARFVWWAYESSGDQVGVPFRPGDEVGIEVVSGEVRIEADGRSTAAGAGERCVVPSAGMDVRCGPAG